jgi:hypothetical protein
MNELNLCGSLFDEDEFAETDVECRKSALENGIIFHEGYLEADPSKRRKMRLLNKHLLPIDAPTEGKFQIPKVLPNKDPLPYEFLPYSAKVCANSCYKGMYCHIDDYKFNSIWTRPEEALRKAQKYKVVIAPDFTLWVDGRNCENVEQIRRSRTIQVFWQINGVSTIQVASWGDADSIMTYAFDGLADDSWTSIGHQRIGSKQEQRLFEFGVRTLVEKKHPYGLIVFGAPLDFDPGVPVIVKPSFIQKLRNL